MDAKAVQVLPILHPIWASTVILGGVGCEGVGDVAEHQGLRAPGVRGQA